VRRAVRAQLGGTEPHLVLLEGVEPARAGGDGGPGVTLRVGLQCPGQPGHAAGQRRPAAAGPCGALQVRVGFVHIPPAQGNAPGQQVRLHRLAAPGCVETGGDLLGVPEQRSGMLAGGVPGLGEDQVGARLPEGPPLRPELPMRLTCLLSGVGRVAGSQGCGGGGEDQLGFLERDPALRRDPAERGVGLL